MGAKAHSGLIERSRSLQRIRSERENIVDQTVLNYQLSVIEFCGAVGMEPDRCLEYIRGHKAELPRLFRRWLKTVVTQSPKTIRYYVAGVRTWLKVNEHRDLETGVIPYWHRCMELLKEKVRGSHRPQGDVQRESLDLKAHDFAPAFLRADKRGRALLAVLLTTGARQVSLRNMTWGDFKGVSRKQPRGLDDEYDEEGKPWQSWPVKVRQKRGFGSYGKSYVAFLTREARNALLEWRQELEGRGGDRSDKAPVFPSEGKPGSIGKVNEAGFLTREGMNLFFQRLVKDMSELKVLENARGEAAIAKDGRPITRHTVTMHLCRKLVKNALISAGINPVYYRALLGHKLNEKDMDELYGRGGIEKMREAYEAAIGKGVFTIVKPPLTLEELQRRIEKNGAAKDAEIKDLENKISRLEGLIIKTVSFRVPAGPGEAETGSIMIEGGYQIKEEDQLGRAILRGQGFEEHELPGEPKYFRYTQPASRPSPKARNPKGR